VSLSSVADNPDTRTRNTVSKKRYSTAGVSRNQLPAWSVLTRQSELRGDIQTDQSYRTAQFGQGRGTAGRVWAAGESRSSFEGSIKAQGDSLPATIGDPWTKGGFRRTQREPAVVSEPDMSLAQSLGPGCDRPGTGMTTVVADDTGREDGGYLSRRQYLALAAGTTGVGATAGGATTGVLDGFSTTDIDQAVILREIESYASGGGVSIIDSSNTAFEVGVTVAQGERYVLHLLVDNRADEQTTQRFKLDTLPQPLSVDLFGDPPTGVEIQQVTHDEWLVNIEPEHPSNSTSVPDNEQIIEVLVDVANTAVPKTYELSGALEPTSV
jgi:hypothetical protein